MELAAATLVIAWSCCLSTVQGANHASTPLDEYDYGVMTDARQSGMRCRQNGGHCVGRYTHYRCDHPNVISNRYTCHYLGTKCCIQDNVCEDIFRHCGRIVHHHPGYCKDPVRSADCQKTCKTGPCAVAAVTTTKAPDLFLPTTSPNFTIGDPFVHWVPLNPWTQEQEEAYNLVKELDFEASKLCNEASLASWDYQTDLTEENRQKTGVIGHKAAKWEVEAWNKAMKYKDQWKDFPDKNLRRLYKEWSILGSSALDIKDLNKMGKLQTRMNEIYSKARVCDFHNSTKCDLRLNPELENILADSTDYDELTHVWKSWRDASGKRMRNKYKCFVKMMNKVAKLNGFKDAADMWRDSYEDDDFQTDMERLWDQVKPLYQQLHAYVRRKLREEYGDNIGPRGPIPAHLLGNMWSQQWTKKYSMLEPYPGKASLDVTEVMIEKNYTAKMMFELSDDFFTSLNLYPMPKEFWDKSVIERAVGKEMVCHASAWEFCNHKDFGIKMCTQINMADLITVHHEMGHIQYYLQFSHQPKWYRAGANAGFHEAIGDTISLSVRTPKHLHKIGLLKKLVEDYEADINFLLKTALEKVAMLPYAFLIDNWRWDVFSGKVKEENVNCHYWKYRTKYQGIKPPVKRSEEDFDPGAKYHIPSNTPYIRYFVSFITQFQFHKALCIKANEYDPNDPSKPLHQCDIYKSHEAGAALKEILQMGASKPWPEALKKITGTDKMDAMCIREYFKPLEDWLKKDNDAHDEYIGWEEDGEYCS